MPAGTKSIDSAVCGRIVVSTDEGRVGQWGGTECYLSWQTSMGACLVVRSSRHKKGCGTFYPLADIQQILAAHVHEGKLGIIVPHGRCVCTILISTEKDTEELFEMVSIMRDKTQWKGLELNVGSKRHREGTRVRQLAPEDAEEFSRRLPLPVSASHSSSDPTLPWNVPVERESEEQEPAAVAVHDEDDLVLSPPLSPTPASQLLLETDDSKYSTAISRTQRRKIEKEIVGEAGIALRAVLSGRNVFLTGAAGTGKSAWLHSLMQDVLPQRHIAFSATASTGIAARALGGSTVYAFSGIGRGEGTFEAILQRVLSRSEVVRGWRECRLLIIDEISVLPGHVFSLLDRVARAVRKEPEKVFGGLQLLLVGDFLQLPPISKGGEEVQFAFQTATWKNCDVQCVELRTNYRHHDDPVLQQACQDIREGYFTTAVQNVVSTCSITPSAQAAQDYLHPATTTLFCRVTDVEAHNKRCMAELETVAFHRFLSEDYAATPGAQLDSELTLPATLTLKVGSQVILLASFPGSSGLANGDVGVVVGFQEQAKDEALPVVQFQSSASSGGGGTQRSITATIPRVRMEVHDSDGRYVTMARTQVPLQLAWALTVHRVQGMTLPSVCVSLDESYFEVGQAYVAVSRVRRREDLLFTAFQSSAIRASPVAVQWYQRVFPKTPDEKAALQKRLVTSGSSQGTTKSA